MKWGRDIVQPIIGRDIDKGCLDLHIIMEVIGPKGLPIMDVFVKDQEDFPFGLG